MSTPLTLKFCLSKPSSLILLVWKRWGCYAHQRQTTTISWLKAKVHRVPVVMTTVSEDREGRGGACGTRLISPVSQLPEQQRSFVVSAAGSCFCFVLAEEVLRERRLFAKREEYHRYHSCHHSCSWRMWTPCRQVAVPIPTPIKCLTRLPVVWRVRLLVDMCKLPAHNSPRMLIFSLSRPW